MNDDDKEDLFASQTWPKTCTCCAKQLSQTEWTNLKFIGIQKSFGPSVPDFELRNCDCSSTLAIVLAPAPAQVKNAVEAC